MKRRRAPLAMVKLVWVLTVGMALLVAPPLYAFGPSVHYHAMRKAHDTLVAAYPDIPILWTVGTSWDQLEADLNGPSHGANVDLDAGLLNGNLPDLVESEFSNVQSGFLRHINGDDSVDISVNVRRLCHYVADGMAIGQISGPSLWGWKDDLIDFACEGVSDKRRWPSYVRDWPPGHFEEGLTEFEEAVLQTYATYRKDADRWFRRFPWVPTSRDVTHMTRRGVAQAATLTSSFVLLAWREATDESQTRPLPPVLYTPVNGADGVPTDSMLEWEPSPEADSYRLQVAENAEFAELVVDIEGILESSFHLDDLLEPGTTHYWRVSATNAYGSGDWSEVWKFVTR